ncbi:hypothetical protein BI364_13675 [Acidihalobacter yilgarnensis]|uniref:Uncharacterized protein n=1 Tax=Acidihalobacter yilgarnensis TaxID=2819280 RepID=A0A1D8IR42_9GAMM|nr:hypothetical protein [Acidihalobacter yilgarnensis]AOU98867.1 hypothetical protein BI364_13675 [Acidihalobacter yilgarnensis]
MATPSDTDQQTREDSASRLPPTAEKDPLGIDQHAPGAKLDAGKSRPELALSGFVLALRSVASRVATGRPDELLACIEAERAAVTAGSASRQTAALANTAALILHTLTGTRCNPLRSLGPLGLPYTLRRSGKSPRSPPMARRSTLPMAVCGCLLAFSATPTRCNAQLKGFLWNLARDL